MIHNFAVYLRVSGTPDINDNGVARKQLGHCNMGKNRHHFSKVKQ